MGIFDELTPGKQRLSYMHHMYAHKNTYNTFTAYEIAQYLENKNHRAFLIQPIPPYYAHRFRSPMSYRHTAIRCGFGVLRKISFVLNKKLGPRQRSGTVLTNAEFVSDSMIIGIKGIRNANSRVVFAPEYTHWEMKPWDCSKNRNEI